MTFVALGDGLIFPLHHHLMGTLCTDAVISSHTLSGCGASGWSTENITKPVGGTRKGLSQIDQVSDSKYKSILVQRCTINYILLDKNFSQMASNVARFPTGIRLPSNPAYLGQYLLCVQNYVTKIPAAQIYSVASHVQYVK